MSREIKFRGKSIQEGQWVYGSAILDYEEKIAYIENMGNGPVPVEWESVGQYTGLMDVEQFNEPKDLYTADIVTMHQFLFDGTEYENEITGVLEYDEELACVCLTKIKQKDIQKHMGYEDDQDGFEGEKVPVCNFHGLHECSWTYLGNIYENKDLLEATNGAAVPPIAD